MAAAAEVAGAASGPGPPLQATPETMQQWMRQEDWEALTKAWQDAEAQVIAWAQGSENEDARMEELWQQASLQPAMSVQSLPPLSQTSIQKSTGRRRRKKWDEDFHLIGNDARRPPPQRRYFDAVPGETKQPRHRRGEGDPKKLQQQLQNRSAMLPPEHLQTRRPWVETHHQTVSPDNEGLHPHLRSYFDRRGLESCYRQRPQVDATTKRMRPRTPQRPSTREKIMRFKSMSESALDWRDETNGTAGRHVGGIHWGSRCQMFNSCAAKVRPKKIQGEVDPIPWVADHHVSVTYDNTELHPALRHYFDVDGLESSFRNRGLQYGRPDRQLQSLGLTEEDVQRAVQQAKKRQSVETTSSWDSIRSSLLDKISYSSLQEADSPGGIPVVRKKTPNSPGQA